MVYWAITGACTMYMCTYILHCADTCSNTLLLLYKATEVLNRGSYINKNLATFQLRLQIQWCRSVSEAGSESARICNFLPIRIRIRYHFILLSQESRDENVLKNTPFSTKKRWFYEQSKFGMCIPTFKTKSREIFFFYLKISKTIAVSIKDP